VLQAFIDDTYKHEFLYGSKNLVVVHQEGIKSALETATLFLVSFFFFFFFLGGGGGVFFFFFYFCGLVMGGTWGYIFYHN